jgi:hypothetical protein
VKNRFDWEDELWYYVNRGDEIFCQKFVDCQARVETGNCNCPLFGNTTDIQTQCHPCGGNTNFTVPFETDPCRYSNIGFIETLRPGRVQELLELMATSILTRNRVTQPPVPIDIIHKVNPLSKIEIRNIPLKACNGALWRMKNEWVMYLNSNDSPLEQRVTVFHELFHIVAHMKGVPMFKKPKAQEGHFLEMLASTFALQMLMPRRYFETAWEKYRDNKVLAEIFQVTPDAVERQMRLMKVRMVTATDERLSATI